MTQVLERYSSYLSQYEAMESSPRASDQPWLAQLRKQAWAKFAELGMPTARRGNERWKYTNVGPIADASFVHTASLPEIAEVAPEVIRESAPWKEDWLNLVFLDGKYSASLSSAQPNPGIFAGSLTDVPEQHASAVLEHIGKHASFEDEGFTALNTAFLHDGAFIHIPAGCKAPSVINLVFAVTDQEQAPVTYPRVLLVAEGSAETTLAESYVSLGSGPCFTNAVTEIALGAEAKVRHCRLLLENEQAYHVGTTRVYQEENSSFTSACFAKGASLGRSDFHALLDGTGAFCDLSGLYLTTGSQHMDNFINIEHAKPHGTSRLLYKGILDGQSRAVFGGTVLVHKDAQHTDAHQTDKNLLLSEDAEVDSKPSLFIYADDVKCGHGATAGHIDAETLFYMRSRGLDLETASRILIQAFAGEIIDTVEPEPLRDYLDQIFSGAVQTPTLALGGG